jgi:hypothetical protein
MRPRRHLLVADAPMVRFGGVACEQDTGGQYEWPYQLSGSGSRRVLSIVMEQGGTTRLHRA